MVRRKENSGRENFIVRYELFVVVIFVGLCIAIGSFLKIFNILDFSSDWLWFLVGVGLVAEATISLIKQIKFDKKYKIIER